MDQRFWPRLRRSSRYHRPLACTLPHQSQRPDFYGTSSEHLGRDSVWLCHSGYQKRMFFLAGLVIIFSGFFRSCGRTSSPGHEPGYTLRSILRFGGRPLQRRLAVSSVCWSFYARGDRFFYVVLTAFVMVSAIMVSYTRARAESLIDPAAWASWSARSAWCW